jgi:hypothetical protein
VKSSGHISNQKYDSNNSNLSSSREFIALNKSKKTLISKQEFLLFLSREPQIIEDIDQENLTKILNSFLRSFANSEENCYQNLDKILANRFLFDFILQNCDQILVSEDGNLLHQLSQSDQSLKLVIICLLASNSQHNYQIFSQQNKSNLTPTQIMLNSVKSEKGISFLSFNRDCNEVIFNSMALLDRSIGDEFIAEKISNSDENQAVLRYFAEFKSRLKTQRSIKDNDKIYANNLANLIAVIKFIHLSSYLINEVEKNFINNFAKILIEKTIQEADAIEDQQAKNLSLFIAINCSLRAQGDYFKMMLQLSDRLLYNSADPNFSCPAGDGIYQKIIFRVLDDIDRPEVLDLLISYGVDLEAKSGSFSAIEICVRNQLVNSLKLMLEKKPSLVNLRNQNNSNPVNIATYLAYSSLVSNNFYFNQINKGYLEVSQILINAKSNIIDKSDTTLAALDFIDLINKEIAGTLTYSEVNLKEQKFAKVKIVRKLTKAEVEENLRKESELKDKIESDRISQLNKVLNNFKKAINSPKPNISSSDIDKFCQNISRNDLASIFSEDRPPFNIFSIVVRFGSNENLVKILPIINDLFEDQNFSKNLLEEAIKNSNEEQRKQNLKTLFSTPEIDIEIKKSTLILSVSKANIEEFRALVNEPIFLHQIKEIDLSEFRKFSSAIRQSVNSSSTSVANKENFKKILSSFESNCIEEISKYRQIHDQNKNHNLHIDEKTEPKKSKNEIRLIKKEKREERVRQEKEQQEKRQIIREIQIDARDFSLKSINQTIENFNEIQNNKQQQIALKLLQEKQAKETYQLSISEAAIIAKQTSSARFIEYLKRDQIYQISSFTDLSEELQSCVENFSRSGADLYLKGSAIYNLNQQKNHKIEEGGNIRKINDLDLEIFIPNIAAKKNSEIVEIITARIPFSKKEFVSSDINKNELKFSEIFTNQEDEKLTIFRQENPKIFTISYSNPKDKIDITIYDSLIPPRSNKSWANSIDAQRIAIRNDKYFSFERTYVAGFKDYQNIREQNLSLKSEFDKDLFESEFRTTFVVNPEGNSVIIRSALMNIKNLVDEESVINALKISFPNKILSTLARELKLKQGWDCREIIDQLEKDFEKHQLSDDDKIRFISTLKSLIGVDKSQNHQLNNLKSLFLDAFENIEQRISEKNSTQDSIYAGESVKSQFSKSPSANIRKSSTVKLVAAKKKGAATKDENREF